MARILVVEDDAHILRLLSIWLNRNGHQVVEAGDGLQAKEELLRARFDLVVSDVNMPGLDGISLVRWLRAEHQSEVPVILLSSRSDQSAIAAELGSLGVRVQPKPFSPSRLMGEIDRELASHAGAV
ncbi:MAG: response regulator [Phycisphaerae bacterium]